MLGSDTFWHLIRATFSCCHFYYKNNFAINLLDKKTRLIIRTDKIIVSNHIFLYLFYLFRLNSQYRTYCTPVLLFHSHNNIATTGVFKIIGKRTNASVYSIWVPTLLKFKLITFDSTSTKKALYIYR